MHGNSTEIKIFHKSKEIHNQFFLLFLQEHKATEIN